MNNVTVEEAEKAFIEALDKSMGILCARGDWYKRKTVRMAFRKGWEQAMEQVNHCNPVYVRDVEILLKSSDKETYVNDQQRIGFQKGAKWMRERLGCNFNW